MDYVGISRNEYNKLMKYTLKKENFEKVSKNKGRGMNNAWAGNYYFPDDFVSTKGNDGKKSNVFTYKHVMSYCRTLSVLSRAIKFNERFWAKFTKRPKFRPVRNVFFLGGNK